MTSWLNKILGTSSTSSSIAAWIVAAALYGGWEYYKSNSVDPIPARPGQSYDHVFTKAEHTAWNDKIKAAHPDVPSSTEEVEGGSSASTRE